MSITVRLGSQNQKVWYREHGGLYLVKRAIIEKLMRKYEVVPSPEDYSLGEIFSHNSFTHASPEEKERIMLKSSEMIYANEIEHPFDRFFEVQLREYLEGKTVLDLGCFTGGRAMAWFERYRLEKVFGIDVRGVDVMAARNFSDKKNATAGFACAVGEYLPFVDECFDAVLSFDVLEHVQDIRRVMIECNRIVKRGGYMMVVFPGFYHPLEHHLSLVTRTPFLHYFFSGEDIIGVYNEIIDKRGSNAEWYSRGELESWERGNTLNGTTKGAFRRLIQETGWRVMLERNPPILGGLAKRKRSYSLFIKGFVRPLAKLRWFEEFLSSRIVNILQKS